MPCQLTFFFCRSKAQERWQCHSDPLPAAFCPLNDESTLEENEFRRFLLSFFLTLEKDILVTRVRWLLIFGSSKKTFFALPKKECMPRHTKLTVSPSRYKSDTRIMLERASTFRLSGRCFFFFCLWISISHALIYVWCYFPSLLSSFSSSSSSWVGFFHCRPSARSDRPSMNCEKWKERENNFIARIVVVLLLWGKSKDRFNREMILYTT